MAGNSTALALLDYLDALLVLQAALAADEATVATAPLVEAALLELRELQALAAPPPTLAAVAQASEPVLDLVARRPLSDAAARALLVARLRIRRLDEVAPDAVVH